MGIIYSMMIGWTGQGKIYIRRVTVRVTGSIMVRVGVRARVRYI